MECRLSSAYIRSTITKSFRRIFLEKKPKHQIGASVFKRQNLISDSCSATEASDFQFFQMFYWKWLLQKNRSRGRKRHMERKRKEKRTHFGINFEAEAREVSGEQSLENSLSSLLLYGSRSSAARYLSEKLLHAGLPRRWDGKQQEEDEERKAENPHRRKFGSDSALPFLLAASSTSSVGALIFVRESRRNFFYQQAYKILKLRKTKMVGFFFFFNLHKNL